jgi:hypothetical protein
MPRRTNVFQEVVAIIHQHMAEGATVEESAVLKSSPAGVEREVDVVIRSRTAGHDIVVSVEATARARPVDISWVEGMVAKHADLPTSKLVLVSESGFTKEARRRAEEKLAVALAPEDIAVDDREHAVLGRLTSLWPKQVTMTARQTQLLLRVSADETLIVRDVALDTMLCLDDRTPAVTLGDIVVAWAENGGLHPLVQEMSSMTEDTHQEFFARSEKPPAVRLDNRVQALFFRANSEQQWYRVEKTQIEGDAAIEVGEIPLRHQRLGEVSFAYGEGTIGTRSALAVVTQDRITVRTKTERKTRDIRLSPDSKTA